MSERKVLFGPNIEIDPAMLILEHGKVFITAYEDMAVIFKKIPAKRQQYLLMTDMRLRDPNMEEMPSRVMPAINTKAFEEGVIWCSEDVESVNDLPAGLVQQIGQLILRLSGPLSEEELYFAVQNNDSFYTPLDTVLSHIRAVQPGYNPGDKTWDDILHDALIADANQEHGLFEKLENIRQYKIKSEAAKKSKENK